MTAKLILLVVVLFNSLLLAVPLPQDHPPRPGQPEFCAVNHRDPQYVCECMKHDEGRGCTIKDGRPGRENENGMAGVCLSHCRISHCHCCLS